jgi:hypothetical protein
MAALVVFGGCRYPGKGIIVSVLIDTCCAAVANLPIYFISRWASSYTGTEITYCVELVTILVSAAFALIVPGYSLQKYLRREWRERPAQNMMDAIIKLYYPDSLPERADLKEAISVACTVLMNSRDFVEIGGIATRLHNGPFPYSTHDLGVATALVVFKYNIGPESKNATERQMFARITVLQWALQGKVAPLLARTFEDALYEKFKPAYSGLPLWTPDTLRTDQACEKAWPLARFQSR